MEAFSLIFPDAVSFILTNFIQPVAKIKSSSERNDFIGADNSTINYEQALTITKS